MPVVAVTATMLSFSPDQCEALFLIDKIAEVLPLQFRQIEESHIVGGDFIDPRHDIGLLDPLRHGFLMDVGQLAQILSVREED